MTTSAPLAEVPEESAPEQTAAIYQDIRDSLGVSKVNLIYRHFATIDQALPWSWQILRPYFINGIIQREAEDTHKLYELATAPITNIEKFVLAESERADIIRVLDFYLLANPMNLFALELLNTKIRQLRPTTARSSKLLEDSELKQEATQHTFKSRADELMFYVSAGMLGVRPTLLRQLAEWPIFIDSIAGFVRATCTDPRFASQVAEIRATVSQRVASFGQVSIPSKLNVESLQQVQDFCGYFPSLLIRMTVIADYLKRELTF